MWCKRLQVTCLLYRLAVASSSASLLHFYVCVVFTIFMPPISLNFECVFIDFFFCLACRNSSSSAGTINIWTEPGKGITLIKVAENWMDDLEIIYIKNSTGIYRLTSAHFPSLGSTLHLTLWWIPATLRERRTINAKMNDFIVICFFDDRDHHG